WSMVFDIGRLQPGETLLVHGGASGVGTMAIQVAHRFGARVIATAGSAAKLAACRKMGAGLAVNYRQQDFGEGARHRAGVVLDNIGGAYLARNVAVLATGGRLVVLGLQGGRKAEIDLGQLMSKRASLHGATLRARPLDQKAKIVAATEAFVWPMIEAGDVRPGIDRRLTLGHGAEPPPGVEAHESRGKVVAANPRPLPRPARPERDA